MRGVRGADIAMIFQEPMTSLNPVFPVGEQIAESIRLHQGMSRQQAPGRSATHAGAGAHSGGAGHAGGRYPHQLSGGMRQRVMIAMALSCRPAVLIADEPTTALDVTIQAQILQLIRVLQQEMEMGVIFITHDMGVVAEIADRVLVMHRGEQVERAPVEQLFDAPAASLYPSAAGGGAEAGGDERPAAAGEVPAAAYQRPRRGQHAAGYRACRSAADFAGARSGHAL